MSKKCSVISEKGEITLFSFKLRKTHWDQKTLKIFSFDFDFEPLIIFSYCSVICRPNVVDLNFLLLFTDALTADNVCSLVQILILTSCVSFYTNYSILDIPIIFYLCKAQSVGSMWMFSYFRYNISKTCQYVLK